jgi:hypothetical protein
VTPHERFEGGEIVLARQFDQPVVGQIAESAPGAGAPFFTGLRFHMQE